MPGKRLQLKHELHSAFHDHMGEEVALSDFNGQRKGKGSSRPYPSSLKKSFWGQLYLCFPFMGRKNLVSYPFNVFLLRCRSCKNGVTPSSIGSGDEELGLLSNSFGHDAVKIHDFKYVRCP